MLPLYNIIFDESFSPSSLKMSLVKNPAVESLFLKFKADEPQQFQFSIASEEEHIIYGIAIRADFPIYRNDDMLGEYLIRFDKDAIVKIESEFLKSQHFNLEHNFDTYAVQVLESFIIDRKNGINPTQFANIEDGSWVLKCKIHNSELWSQIKSGEFAGFSIEAFFSYSKVEMCLQDSNSTRKTTKLNKHKMNIKQIRTRLAKMLLRLGAETAVKDGQEFLLEFDGAELIDGTEVFITDENGELIHPEDGEYTINDEIWQITDGIIKKVVVAEPEPVVEAEAEPEPEPESEVDIRTSIDLINKRIDEMSKIMEDFANLSANITKRLEELESKLASVSVQTPEKLEKQTLKSGMEGNPYACLQK